MLDTARQKASEANQRAGEELLKTTDQIQEFGFGSKMRAATASRMDNRGQLGLGTVLAALVVVIAVSLAVIVVDRFDNSLGNPSSSSLSTAQNDVLSGFADMTSLIGPLLLVAIAVVIIGLIRRVQ
jgi:hypothetical protein